MHFSQNSELEESEEESYDYLSEDGTFDDASSDTLERHHSKRSTNMSAHSVKSVSVQISPSYQVNVSVRQAIRKIEY